MLLPEKLALVTRVCVVDCVCVGADGAGREGAGARRGDDLGEPDAVCARACDCVCDCACACAGVRGEGCCDCVCAFTCDSGSVGKRVSLVVRFGTIGGVDGDNRGEAPEPEAPEVLRSNSGFAAAVAAVVVLAGFLSRGQL